MDYKMLNEILEINPKLPLKKGTYAKKIAMENLSEYQMKIKTFSFGKYKGGSKFQNGDTLLAKITPCLENGKIAYVDILEDEEIAFGSTEFFVIRGLEGKGDDKYIYYLMNDSRLKDKVIKSMVGTSGRQRAQKESILNYEYPVPDYSMQKKIGEFLYLFDKKIQTDKEIINNLEHISQTLFKRWFIDFEFPNEDGEPYKSSGGKMIDLDIGRIPANWKVKKFKDIVELIDNRGKTPPLAKDKTEYPILDVKVVSGLSRVIELDKAQKFVEKNTYDNWFRSGHPKKGDILLSTVGSIGETKLFMGNKGCIAQNVVALRANGNENFYLYEYLKFIKKELLSYNIGSVQPSIKITHILKKEIIVPENRIIEQFNYLYKTINEKIFLLSNQLDRLNQVRDTLLPKLLSGEIKIPDNLEV
ncbi:restriction endonuclease subunit S [Abyssicoccus albus]|uniref:restriction endonuclease subunit S n=1 Tax=Abyssicoccus albus TaxID=1817405 RepID=UPI001CEF7006|nr:restriction endonuclease subunit S [Abyssicoccus albus]